MSYEIGKALKRKKSGKKIFKAEKKLTKSTGLKKLNFDKLFIKLIEENPQLEVLFTKKN
tara:strand:+ start:685 stop:861 length:177 start_codon:yes stop_codon:yes gene_type:complete